MIEVTNIFLYEVEAKDLSDPEATEGMPVTVADALEDLRNLVDEMHCPVCYVPEELNAGIRGYQQPVGWFLDEDRDQYAFDPTYIAHDMFTAWVLCTDCAMAILYGEENRS